MGHLTAGRYRRADARVRDTMLKMCFERVTVTFPHACAVVPSVKRTAGAAQAAPGRWCKRRVCVCLSGHAL